MLFWRKGRTQVILAGLFALTSLVCAQNRAAEAPQQINIRVGVNLVRVPARVVGETGDPIRNLRTSDFRVFEDGREQRVAVFGEDHDPVYVALVVDTSASVAQHFSFLVDAAEKFAARFGPEDRLALYEAGPDVARLLPFTKDRVALSRAMRNLISAPTMESLAAKRTPGSSILKRNTGKGGTLLYDALILARKDFPVESDRRIVVVFTDGWDSGSTSDFAALQKAFVGGSEQLFSVIVTTSELLSKPALFELHGETHTRARRRNWSLVIDTTAPSRSAARLERAAAAFLNELPADASVSLFTYDSRFLPMLPPRSGGRNVKSKSLSVPEGRQALQTLRSSRAERESQGARNSKVRGDTMVILTAGDNRGIRGLLKQLPPGQRPVVINVDDLKSERDITDRMRVLAGDPNGVRRTLMEIAFAESERVRLQLPKLSLDTGGNTFAVERGEDLDATYLNIAYQIRSSYALGYYTDPRPGLREIQVTVADPRLRVHARRAVQFE